MNLCNNHLFRLLLLFFFTTTQFILCGSSVELKNSYIMNVHHQKILLLPFEGWENIISSDYWPHIENVDDLLIRYIQQVWKSLFTEFRLCEKYGLYKMVDSTELNTVEISLKIVASELRNDTLFIPIEISTYQIETNRRYSTEINAYGILPDRSNSAVPLSIDDLVAVFDDYKRRFPYKKVVTPYYLRESN